jgi:hypothetical protein
VRLARRAAGFCHIGLRDAYISAVTFFAAFSMADMSCDSSRQVGH